MPRCNKKVLGKMKDEDNGVIVLEFVGLRSKMYSNRLSEECVQECNKTANKLIKIVSKKSKRVKKCTIEKRISLEDYKDSLFNKKEYYKPMILFRSTRHELYSIKMNKLALSAKDDKRFIL